ncbi:CHAT domain-containing protein [bacterium]|nr:CHAT domain-containing protein [bacterium]
MKFNVLFFIIISTQAFATDFSADLKQLDIHLKKGEYKDVLKLASSVAQKAQKEKNWSAQGRALVYCAQASYSMRHPKEMQTFLENAIAIFKAHNDYTGLAKSYYVYSFYYLNSNNVEEMYRLLEIASRYADKTTDNEVHIRILLALGNANWNLGKFSEAILRSSEAARLAKQNHYDHLLALAHEGLAINYLARADFPQALENYRQSLVIFQKENNPHAIAIVYGNMGATYEEMGDFENAMNLFEKSLELHKKSDYRYGQSVQYDNIAEIHNSLGHYDQAMEFSLKSLELLAEEARWFHIHVLQNVAERFLSINNVQQAEFYAAQAQKELTDQQNTPLLLRNRILMARLELQRNVPIESLRWSTEGISMAERIGDYYQFGMCEGLKAQALVRLKQPAEAAGAYLRAIALHEQIYSYEFVSNWYAELAELQAQSGDDKAAISNFENSLSAVAAASDLFTMNRFRVDIFRASSRVYRSYASYLAEHQMYDDAWHILEEGRARDLRLRITQATGIKSLNREQTDLLGQIHKLQDQLSEGDLKSEALPVLYARLQKSGSEYKKLRNPLPSEKNSTTKIFGKPNTLYVEYAVHENSLLVFSSNNGKTQFRRVESTEKVQELTGKYLAALSSSSNTIDRAQGKELYRILLQPEIKNHKEIDLIIIPDGFLYRLPFAALINDEDEFLIEHHCITYAPSMNSLMELQRPGHISSDRILSIANSNFKAIDGLSLPPLPLAPKEAAKVAEHGKNSEILVDESEQRIKAIDFSKFGIVHFATHSLIDETQPQHSSIVLKPTNGEDGFFRATEIYAMRIPSNMVMLSSCRSGSGTAVPGEGLLGLSHAFFSAGARSLVMTYWNVSDQTAQEFSERFYSNLHNHTIADAIRETQVNMIRSKDWNHPVNWAAFFVEGDSGQKIQIKRPWNQTLLPILLLIIVSTFIVAIYFRLNRKKFRTAP